MKKGIIIVAIAIALVLAAGAALVCGLYANVGGQLHKIGETVLDLSGTELTDLKPLSRFKQLVRLDISGTAVTELGPLKECSLLKRVCANGCEIPAEEVHALERAIPGIVIEWDVAIGDRRVPAGTETFAAALGANELNGLTALEMLRSADLSGSDLCEALLALPGEMPDCDFYWTVPLGETVLPSDSTEVALSGVTGAELKEKLRYLPALTAADITACELTLAETDALLAAYPAVSFTYTVADGMTTLTTDPVFASMDCEAVSEALGRMPAARTADVTACALTNEELLKLKTDFPSVSVKGLVNIGTERVPADAASVTVPEGFSYAEIASACVLLTGTAVDLRETALTEEELTTLAQSCPAIHIGRTVTVRGRTFYSLIEEADFSGETFSDVAEAEAVLSALPCLKKLILCDCGLTNEQMETLIAAYPATRFVWTVSLGPHKKLRTDATAFSTFNRAKNISKVDSPELAAIKRNTYRLTTEDIRPLKYCTDLVALDLGHNNIDDISVLGNCPHLKWLIIADNFLSDVSVVAELPELEYVEFFMNDIVDVSPFASCENLLDLNLCNNDIEDFSPLFGMQQLERLWYWRCPGSKACKEAIEQALPNCETKYNSDGDTGSGWREHDRYFEMRKLFTDAQGADS